MLLIIKISYIGAFFSKRKDSIKIEYEYEVNWFKNDFEILTEENSIFLIDLYALLNFNYLNISIEKNGSRKRMSNIQNINN